MGPRLFSRGKTPGTATDSPTSRPLQWGRGCSAAESRNHSPMAHTYSVLQWGRGCSAAERGGPPGSIQPPSTLQWGRGCSAAERVRRSMQSRRRTGRFNGAAAVQPRKGALAVGICPEYLEASMGPRLFSRGKLVKIRSLTMSETELQWGRGCSAAESVTVG